MTRWNPFRFFTETVSFSGEGTGLFLIRFSNTHAGIVVPIALIPSNAVCKWAAWQKFLHWLLPLFRIEIWGHTHQSDQRWVFRLTILGKTIGWLTQGDDPSKANGLLWHQGLGGL